MSLFEIYDLTVEYSDGTESLQGVTMNIEANEVTCLIGPAGGGKSTFLRVLNRLNDLADVKKVSGKVMFKDMNLLDPKIDVIDLRRRIGMVFARPLPLPLSLYENVAYGLRTAGERSKAKLDRAVEQALRQAQLWDEVYDRLDAPASRLSGGQQQRLCLARTLSLEPEVVLLDEPTSALDPISTAKIESSILELKESYTFIVAPHSIQQAGRIADHVAFFLQGELVEYQPASEIFTRPRDKRTEDYLQGRFG